MPEEAAAHSVTPALGASTGACTRRRVVERGEEGRGVAAGSRGLASGSPGDVVSRRLHARQRRSRETSARHGSRAPGRAPWLGDAATCSSEPPCHDCPTAWLSPAPARGRRQRSSPAPQPLQQPWRCSMRHPAGCRGWGQGAHPWVAPRAGSRVPMHVARLSLGTWAASCLRIRAFHSPGAKYAGRSPSCPSTMKSPAVPVTGHGSTRHAPGLVTPSLGRSPHACPCLCLALQISSPATGHHRCRHNRATRSRPASCPWLSPSSAVGGP